MGKEGAEAPPLLGTAVETAADFIADGPTLEEVDTLGGGEKGTDGTVRLAIADERIEVSEVVDGGEGSHDFFALSVLRVGASTI